MKDVFCKRGKPSLSVKIVSENEQNKNHAFTYHSLLRYTKLLKRTISTKR